MRKLNLRKEKESEIHIREVEGRDVGSEPTGVGELSQSLKTNLPKSILDYSLFSNPYAFGRVSLFWVFCDLLDAFFFFVCFWAFWGFLARLSKAVLLREVHEHQLPGGAFPEFKCPPQNLNTHTYRSRLDQNLWERARPCLYLKKKLPPLGRWWHICLHFTLQISITVSVAPTRSRAAPSQCCLPLPTSVCNGGGLSKSATTQLLFQVG